MFSVFFSCFYYSKKMLPYSLIDLCRRFANFFNFIFERSYSSRLCRYCVAVVGVVVVVVARVVVIAMVAVM